mmetsp:Transcript_52734/g.140003  ORF Transcript_52734/g.140003 Transcript_52734/m.140003 type:complete len:260 (-) Transcript_52734:146-925(-)
MEEQVAILSGQKPGPRVMPHGCRELVRVHCHQIASVVALQLPQVPPVRPENGLADPRAFNYRLLLSVQPMPEVHARALQSKCLVLLEKIHEPALVAEPEDHLRLGKDDLAKTEAAKLVAPGIFFSLQKLEARMFLHHGPMVGMPELVRQVSRKLVQKRQLASVYPPGLAHDLKLQELADAAPQILIDVTLLQILPQEPEIPSDLVAHAPQRRHGATDASYYGGEAHHRDKQYDNGEGTFDLVGRADTHACGRELSEAPV